MAGGQINCFSIAFNTIVINFDNVIDNFRIIDVVFHNTVICYHFYLFEKQPVTNDRLKNPGFRYLIQAPYLLPFYCPGVNVA
ncbi:hypothetical protein D3C73_963130 [compost metagenome]